MPFRSSIRPSLVFRSGARHVARVPARKQKPIHTGADVYRFIWNDYARGLHTEHVWVLPMSTAGNMVLPAPVELARGSVEEVMASIPDILTVPLLAGVQAFVIVHNHPAGEPTPSISDYGTVRHMLRAARTLNLTYWDDVIVAENDYFSFREDTRLFRRRRRR